MTIKMVDYMVKVDSDTFSPSFQSELSFPLNPIQPVSDEPSSLIEWLALYHPVLARYNARSWWQREESNGSLSEIQQHLLNSNTTPSVIAFNIETAIIQDKKGNHHKTLFFNIIFCDCILVET